ncbi:hypothetical protein AB0P17_15475 [Streptomyces sp. NPDC088124]|uniref:hypothetical protein n=1 Tax=Streptomyces sp. NPDC088124 TaxID=3154654 RepID=UPI00341699B4
MYVLAASDTGPALGALGAGGIALAMAFLLVLGVQGKGKVKLKDNPALICGFIAGTAFSAAGAIWSNPERLTGQGLAGLGVGTGDDGVFGNVGLGAVSLILLILMLCWSLTPFRGVVLGLVAAVVWPAAGGGTIWAVPSELAGGVLMMFGGA